jgi:hypothetical protein
MLDGFGVVLEAALYGSRTLDEGEVLGLRCLLPYRTVEKA